VKVLTIVKSVFLLAGVVLITVTGILYANTRSFLADAVRAEGTVVALEAGGSSNGTVYRPIVRFAGPNGVVEFTSSLGSRPPAYNTGDTVSVLYRASDPHGARIESFVSLWLAAVITGSLGTIFSSISGIMFFVPMRRARIKEDLLRNGTPIQTDFQSVQLNGAVTVNGQSPFRVMTQWLDPATSLIHVFKSENLWFDPTRYITQKQITVFIDNANPKRYYVDLSFLPKPAD